jgi:hypothetical protein
MSIRITRLAALVAAMLFATGASSQATYTLSTSVSNFTFNGASVALTSLAAGSMITVGSSTITLANGGYQYTDSASGQTVYLGNDSEVGTLGVLTTQEQIFVNVPTTASGFFNFTTNILVNGGAAFTETLGNNPISPFPQGYVLTGTSIVGTTATVSPSSVTIPGFLITNIQALANSGTTNSTTNNPAVSATFLATIPPVPEPASVVMLGLGLISVGGVAFRRRMAK